ncbi:hypothetical protein FS842_005959 [Serendipita sp. 407]|nr:hypothetical protein FS842_005959 [Serendipita sp. 407]
MYLHLPLTFMIATAGLVASAAIPVSLGPDSTSTSRSSDAATSLNLIKRAQVTHALQNPITPEISAKTSAKRIEYHNSMADQHSAAGRRAGQAVQLHKEDLKAFDEMESITKGHHVKGLVWENQRAKAEEALNKATVSADYHEKWALAHRHLREASRISTNSKSGGRLDCDSVASAFAHHQAALELIPPHYEGTTPTEGELAVGNQRQKKWLDHSQGLQKDIMSKLETMSDNHRSSSTSVGAASFGIDESKIGRAPPLEPGFVDKFKNAIGDCTHQ